MNEREPSFGSVRGSTWNRTPSGLQTSHPGVEVVHGERELAEPLDQRWIVEPRDQLRGRSRAGELDQLQPEAVALEHG
jgi:hypothetical protein